MLVPLLNYASSCLQSHCQSSNIQGFLRFNFGWFNLSREEAVFEKEVADGKSRAYMTCSTQNLSSQEHACLGHVNFTHLPFKGT